MVILLFEMFIQGLKMQLIECGAGTGYWAARKRRASAIVSHRHMHHHHWTAAGPCILALIWASAWV
jgi:hypothetical protein